MYLKNGDHLITFEIKRFYRHMYLHPDVRDFFKFRYAERVYRYLAMPFWWERSGLLFAKFLRPFFRHLWDKCGFHDLPYIDDFIISPSPPGGFDGVIRGSLPSDSYSPRQQPWPNPQRREGILGRGSTHLTPWVLFYTQDLWVFVQERKGDRIRSLYQYILHPIQRNRRNVSHELVRHFFGVGFSISLSIPLARFYSRSLFTDIASAERCARDPSPRGAPRSELSRPSRFHAYLRARLRAGEHRGLGRILQRGCGGGASAT